MKTKTMIATALLTAGLGFGVVNTTANAASWHKGTPKVLRGNWNNRKGKVELQVSRKSIYVMPYNGAAISRVKSIKYRYVGNHTYQYHQKFQEGGSHTGKIRLSNNHHYVKVQGISGLFSKR